MRFKKREKSEFEDTRRKRLAALRSQRRERDRFPLLAGQIEEQQPNVDAVMAHRAEDWQKTEQRMRDYRAAKWREGRQRLAAYDPENRRAIRAYWNAHRWFPGDPNIFLYVLNIIDKGKLIRDGETFRHAEITISASQAVDALEPPPAGKPPMLPGLRREAPKTAGRA